MLVLACLRLMLHSKNKTDGIPKLRGSDPPVIFTCNPHIRARTSARTDAGNAGASDYASSAHLSLHDSAHVVLCSLSPVVSVLSSRGVRMITTACTCWWMFECARPTLLQKPCIVSDAARNCSSVYADVDCQRDSASYIVSGAPVLHFNANQQFQPSTPASVSSVGMVLPLGSAVYFISL